MNLKGNWFFLCVRISLIVLSIIYVILLLQSIAYIYCQLEGFDVKKRCDVP
jgi:hypothetical protein